MESSGLQVFSFEEKQVRIIVLPNEELGFVAKDVAEAIGYPESSLNQPNNLFSHIPEEWKGYKQIMVRSKNGVEQVREVLCLKEQGLYFFLARSDKPAALPFQKKIAGEILPSIRKHGAYMTPQVIEETLTNPDFIIRLATQLKAEQEKRRELEERVKEDHPKVLFADSVSASTTAILIGDLAKLIKQNGVEIGQKRLFEWLRENGYLMKGGSSKNMPTQRALDMKLFEVLERAIDNPDGSIRITRTTKVTGRGQVYFINQFLGGPKRAA
jgi:anti-repressor protein